MMSKSILKALTIAATLIFPSMINNANAQEQNNWCPDAGLLSGKLITDICWDCIFPIRIAGATMGGEGTVPPGASDEKLCRCDDAFGMPQFGVGFSMWMPSRVVELVRYPGCSMAMGGVELPLSDQRQLGTRGNQNIDDTSLAFYHYHLYAFPILFMMELFTEEKCFSDGFLDFDIMYLSEVDPTWNNDELAFFTHPEAAAVANPAAIGACAVDATAASVDYPMDELFWCAGSWGHLYPLSGHTRGDSSLARQTAHLATRAMAAQHRRGMAWRTKGEDAMCEAKIDPIFPKTQYKLSMFYPVAQTDDSAVIGESTYKWGEHRQIPGVGEDALYVLYNWKDCCMTW